MKKRILIVIIAITVLIIIGIVCVFFNHEHEWGEWETAMNATCVIEGMEIRSCECGEKETKIIRAKGHTTPFGQWTVIDNPTCTENGSEALFCSVCKATIDTRSLTKLDHSYESTVIQKATAKNKAIVKYDCARCDYSYTQEIEPITISAKLTDCGTMFTDRIYRFWSFEAEATGGFGSYQYKFEIGNEVMQDFSSENSVSVYGHIDTADSSFQVKITVIDDAGQKTICVIKGDGTHVYSKIVYK